MIAIVVPPRAATPSGSGGAKRSATASPSSSSPSSVADTWNDRLVDPEVNVTLAGTPE